MRIAIALILSMSVLYVIYQKTVIDSLESKNELLTKQRDEAVDINKNLLLKIDELGNQRDKEIEIMNQILESKESNERVIKEIKKEVRSDKSKESSSILTARAILNRLQQQRDSNSSRN
ncbi:hypothetical protein [Campylobacter devanensis]|uniref:hypothetical protein n=1 Tax=Campylobacter devanensis TaxID=3161138 RepID=UPI000A338F1D|nr:hypothetical protein [Campylobacter sp. P0227]